MTHILWDIFKLVFRIVFVVLMPLWLYIGTRWIAESIWVSWVVPTVPDPLYPLAYRLTPVALMYGPLLMVGLLWVLLAFRVVETVTLRFGILAFVFAVLSDAYGEYSRLTDWRALNAPQMSSWTLASYADAAIVAGAIVGLLIAAVLWFVAERGTADLAAMFRRANSVKRGKTGTFGRAEWLDMETARKVFPEGGGIVVGEAARPDLEKLPAFDKDDPKTWGEGGKAPLLEFGGQFGSTHGLVFAGSGGFKTTSVVLPTMARWQSPAVVLDPSLEIAPMVREMREAMGRRVVQIDPRNPGLGAFNVLDWIRRDDPMADTNIESVAGWLTGEKRPDQVGGQGSKEFFVSSGQSMVIALISDLIYSDEWAPEERTLKTMRALLAEGEEALRARLEKLSETSPSPVARDLAGTLKKLVPETFSGVYANAANSTRWLATPAYADLVSGNVFKTREICEGKVDVFVNLPLKVLDSVEGIGRVIIGALLNAVYEADGDIKDRVLFCLDEVARLKYMGLLETARDAGRKYGITLLLLYQSIGQLQQQFGREGRNAWFESSSWRAFAMIGDQDTAELVAKMAGEFGAVNESEAKSAGSSVKGGDVLGSRSDSRNTQRGEVKRELIKADEITSEMRPDEQIVFVKGYRPIRCGRAMYFRRPEMVAKIKGNRFHKSAKPAA